MKKATKILLIIGIVLILGGVLFIVFNKKDKTNNNNNNPNGEKSLITFNTTAKINIETAFIENNNYMIIILENKDSENIVEGNLKVKFNKEKVEKTMNLLPVGNKVMFKVTIPEGLRKNINKEKIEINLYIVKKGNDFKFIDVSKISDTKVKTNVVDNDTIIDISSVNKIGEDINALNGFVVLYNLNKIVSAKDFRIENIKNNNDFKTSITISKIVVPSTELNPDEVNYGPVNYDKIEVYYTFAY